MKKIFLLICVFMTVGFWTMAQHIQNNSGKTYYDSSHSKLKEVYSYKEVNTFSVTGDHTISNVTYKKHGPYFYYYENGKIKIKGNYKNDKKDGKWEFFNEQGKLDKTENYLNSELQQ